MSEKIIRITDSFCNEKQPNQSYLVLEDGGSTVVEPSDVVVWKVENSKIESILIQDDKSTNLFVPDPAPVEGTKNQTWQGTIRRNLQAGQEENYRIYWSEHKKVYSYDPKIQVKS